MVIPKILLFISLWNRNYGMYYILLESLETHLSNGTLLKSLALVLQMLSWFWG